MSMRNRDGETNINRLGYNMTIINYKSNANFDILFDDGYIKHCTCYNNFKNGRIKNPNSISFFGVGYLNEELEGKYSSEISYKTWIHMLSRCYDKSETRYRFYGGKGVCVCDEWLSYKNFKEWFMDNYYEVPNEKMNLDKDILNKENKIYSKDNCIFVPSSINKIFTKSNSIRGDYPIGVIYNKKNRKYISKVSKENKGVHLGCFDNPKDAFLKYKQEKEKYIQQIAEEYKDRIPQKLYDAMYKYTVEEDD